MGQPFDNQGGPPPGVGEPPPGVGGRTAESPNQLKDCIRFVMNALGCEQTVKNDSQFKIFVRFLIDALEEAAAEPDEEKRSAKMARIIEHLKKSLED